jgi:hypothetical protein
MVAATRGRPRHFLLGSSKCTEWETKVHILGDDESAERVARRDDEAVSGSFIVYLRYVEGCS